MKPGCLTGDGFRSGKYATYVVVKLFDAHLEVRHFSPSDSVVGQVGERLTVTGAVINVRRLPHVYTLDEGTPVRTVVSVRVQESNREKDGLVVYFVEKIDCSGDGQGSRVQLGCIRRVVEKPVVWEYLEGIDYRLAGNVLYAGQGSRVSGIAHALANVLIVVVETVAKRL